MLFSIVLDLKCNERWIRISQELIKEIEEAKCKLAESFTSRTLACEEQRETVSFPLFSDDCSNVYWSFHATSTSFRLSLGNPLKTSPQRDENHSVYTTKLMYSILIIAD